MFVCLAISSALQEKRETDRLGSWLGVQQAIGVRVVAYLTCPHESQYLPDSEESHYLCSDIDLLITYLTPRTEMGCVSICVCLKFSDF